MSKENKKSRMEDSIKKNVENTEEIIEEQNNNEKIKISKKNNFKKKKKKRKVLKIMLIVILILLIMGIAVFSAYLVKSKGNIASAALDIVTDIVGEQEPIFALILGVSEDISVPLTDTIILAGYNPKTQNAFMVSIPRDTYVGTNQVWANGYDKINAQYQDSCEKTITSVEELTGVTIDYYVVIKNTALIDVVDSIGGVEFDVPIDMDYDDITQNLHIHLNAGIQTLTGEQAEGLVRFRHNNDGSSYPTSYGDNDYGRMRTQREFIKTLAKQMIQLDNVPKVKDIATAVFDNLETDIELSKALAYVPFALELDIENNLRMEQLPGQSDLINELWFYVPNYEKIGDLFDELIASLELEDHIENSHYERINKKNIKITKKEENKTDKNTEVEVNIEKENTPQVTTPIVENTVTESQTNQIIENPKTEESTTNSIENVTKNENTNNSENTIKDSVTNKVQNTNTTTNTNKNTTTNTNTITKPNVVENTVKNEVIETVNPTKPTTDLNTSKDANNTVTNDENTKTVNSQ